MSDKNKVIEINPTYIKYRRMWKENRWQFSGDLVRLTIKQNKYGLDNIEQYTLDTINRIIDENGGKWTEGYDYNNGILNTNNKKRIK
ncbi:MAG: hypothetical protein ABS939_08260 [Psychrobacillus sp.]